MARPLRIEFPGAIYHVMSRGNGRKRIFHDQCDYERFLKGLESAVMLFAWELFAFVLMPNHIHLFLRTLEANLSQSMQRLLSGYANWYAKRHRQPGHLLQGRFKGELVEDESYFWTLSRYIHLNPVRGKRPLVSLPQDWPWSSYPGYYDKRDQKSWIAYERIHESWQGETGGDDPGVSYRRYVEAGVADPPANPFRAAKFGWILGSDTFVDRIRQQMKRPTQPDEVPLARPLMTLELDTVFDVVTHFFDISPALFRESRNPHIVRPLVAWLARRHTPATLREIAPRLGLTHPGSVGNLTRRIDNPLDLAAQVRRQIVTLDGILLRMRSR